jgi:hypothetical protein
MPAPITQYTALTTILIGCAGTELDVVRNEHEIVVDAPAGVVFAWVADVDAWRRWRPSEGHLERVTAGSVGVGTTWQASSRVMDEQITVAVEVTAYEPDVRFGLRVSGSIQAEQTFTLEPVAGGTRLGVTLDLANPDLAEPARQQWDADLRTLKSLLEAEP